MPTLDELYNGVTQNKRPSLDELYAQPEGYGITQTEQWPTMPDTTDTASGKRSPMYTDAATGQTGERHLGNFVPSSSHIPLPQKQQPLSVASVATFTGTEEYKAQPPEVQRQMLANYMNAMPKQQKLFSGGGTRPQVIGVGGTELQRAQQTEKPIEYLQGEMPHRSLTDPKFYTENIPRSAVRTAGKAVTLAPLIAGGLPAFAGYGLLEAGTAALDARGNESMTGKFTESLGEQAAGLGRMLSDPVNIFERKDPSQPWTPANTRSSYAWDSPGEALLDTYFGYHTAKGAVKYGKNIWDTKIATKPNQEMFMRTAADSISNMVTGEIKGKRTPAQRKEYDRKTGEAFEFILQNKDLFNVLDNEGQRIELPRNRVELAEFVEQAKKLAFTEYDYLRQQAGDIGAGVKLDPVIAELEKIISDPKNQIPEAAPIIKAATNKLEALRKFAEENNSQYTPLQAQNAITIANEKLKSMYGKGASYEQTVDAVVDKGIADIMRKELDNTIQEATGSEYQTLKNKYGALKAIESDVNRAANRQRNTPDFTVDFGDIYTMSKFALAAAKLDPTIAAGATAGWLMKATAKRYTPDPTIERTFKKLNKLVDKAADNSFVGPEGTGVRRTPRDQFIPAEGIRETPYNTPEGVDPAAREMNQAPDLERGATPNVPMEFDPSLRNIAPEGTTRVRDPLSELKFDVQGAVGQVRNHGGPSPVTGVRPPAGEQVAARSESPVQTPMEKYPLPESFDETSTRASLNKFGFSTEEINNLIDGMKKGIIPAAAITAYMTMDDEQRKSVGLLGAIGIMGLTGKGKEPVFYSQLGKVLADIVPKERVIAATPDVQLKGVPERRIQTPLGEKVLPAKEGSVVKGKPVDQVLFEMMKALGVKEAEFRASGIREALKGKTKVVNRKLLPNETDAITVDQLQKITENKLPRLGEDVYGKTNTKLRIEEVDGKYDIFDNAGEWTGKTFRDYSEAIDYVKESQGKEPQFATYQAIKGGDIVPGSYTEKFVTLKPNKLSVKMQPGKPGKYQIVDSNGKVINDFLTKEQAIEQSKQASWYDEHSQYSDTKNPMVRIRYDDITRDGKKIRRLQEIQEPKQVNIDAKSAEAKAREAYNKSIDAQTSKRQWEDLPRIERKDLIEDHEARSIVPQDLATRAMDIGIKQLLADAKRDGIDGIEWATGEQTRDLYNNALRQVVDEARWNPETQKLTIYKNGRVSDAQSKIPKVVTKEMLPDIIGKAGAERLLSSERGLSDTSKITWKSGVDNDSGWPDLKYKDYQIIDFTGNSGGYEVYKGYSKIGNFKSLDSALRSAERSIEENFEKTNKDLNLNPNEYRATDLSIDATWPGKLYGDFSGERLPKKVDWKQATTKLGFEDFEVEAGAETAVINGEAYNIVPLGSKWQLQNQDLKILAEDFKSKDAAKQYASEKLLGQVTGDFNYSATVPRLLKQYGKGEFGVGEGQGYRVERLGDGDYAIVTPNGVRFQPEPRQWFTTRKAAEAELESYKKNGMLNEVGSGQPVMWLTKDTPSSFPMYEGVTGIFKMLQEEIKKEGGKAGGVAKVALKYGVPAALLAKFLSGDDEGRKKILAMPVMAGIIAYHGGSKNILKDGIKIPPGESGAFYTTNKNLANVHRIGNKNGIVHAAEININNPYIVDYKGTDITRNNAEESIREAKSLGHDGVIIKNFVDMPENRLDVVKRFGKTSKYAGDIYIAFNKEQISNIRGINPRLEKIYTKVGLYPEVIKLKNSEIHSFKDSTGKIVKDTKGNPLGIKAEYTSPREITITEAYLPEELPKGEGIGSGIYKTIIDKAIPEGKTVWSGDSTTGAATGVWEKLKREGYDVAWVKERNQYRVTKKLAK